MNFKIIFALCAFSSVLAIDEYFGDDESFDANDLDARAIPVCYCCSGFVVSKIAGTRCGAGEPAQLHKYPISFANKPTS